MFGMEQLLSNMIGIKPDEMKEIFDGLLSDAQESVAALKRIEQNQLKILSHLERIDNGAGNDGNN